ncbi:uncharacterized protein LOC125837413 [Solanum verrucosum]|uniref:uncharacterized protein LOC125837413 n=1 Tax=Solanum verrucosum TaxID=315347 RepID=UPI0020D0C36C|nr:uncharacterized protein LOC125837413 [Solanum verrucosum]
MANTRANARRNEKNVVDQEVPPQPPQALINPMDENVTNAEFRSAIQMLAQTMMTHSSGEPNVGMPALRVRYFMRMNPPEFYGSKIEEDPKEFIAESKLKEKNKEVKRDRTGDGNSSNARSDGQGRTRFKQRYSGQDSPNTSKFNQEKGGESSLPKPNCTKCGRNHHSRCLAGMDGCYGCGKSGHKMRDCPMLKAKGREGKQATPSGPNSNAPKQNWFYALQARGEEECAPMWIPVC